MVAYVVDVEFSIPYIPARGKPIEAHCLMSVFADTRLRIMRWTYQGSQRQVPDHLVPEVTTMWVLSGVPSHAWSDLAECVRTHPLEEYRSPELADAYEHLAAGVDTVALTLIADGTGFVDAVAASRLLHEGDN